MPHDQRTRSAYLFGAICAAQDKSKGAPVVLPRRTGEAMALHQKEISRAVGPDAHATVLLDQAGFYTSAKLLISGNTAAVAPKSPARNPVENMRGNSLSNRVLVSYRDVHDHCCFAWNTLVEHPWTKMSIELRDWTRRL